MRKAGGFLSGFAVALGAGIAYAAGPRKENGTPPNSPTPKSLDLQILRAELHALAEREAARLAFLGQRLEALEANAAGMRASCFASPDSADHARIEAIERALAEQGESLAAFREWLLRTDENLAALFAAVDRLCVSVGATPSRKPSSAFDEQLRQEIARP